MKILELFAGTRSIGKAFERAGHEVYSIDWDKNHKNIDWYTDISLITKNDILERFGQPDIIWASPDCTTYSVVGLRYHRTTKKEGYKPKSEYAKLCDEMNPKLISLINDLNPKYFFIENPRGAYREMDWVKGIPRYTITYCQYGDWRMKPTDIWTNHATPNFLPMCHSGWDCHAGGKSKKSTQNVHGNARIKIPDKLCEHIVKISEV